MSKKSFSLLSLLVAMLVFVSPVLAEPSTPPAGYYRQRELVAGWLEGWDLHTALSSMRFTVPYRYDVYDCTERAALMEFVAENAGHDAYISCNPSHCWVMVEFDGEYRAYDNIAGWDANESIYRAPEDGGPYYSGNRIENIYAFNAYPEGYNQTYQGDWWEYGNYPQRPWTWKGEYQAPPEEPQTQWVARQAPRSVSVQPGEVQNDAGQTFQVCDGLALGPQANGAWCSAWCAVQGHNVLVYEGSCRPWPVVAADPEPAYKVYLPFTGEGVDPFHSTAPSVEPNTFASPLPYTGSGLNLPPNIAQWEPLIVRYAQKYGLDPALVAAVMTVESGGRADAISWAGAVGLMQVMPSDSRPALFYDRPNTAQLKNPETNLDWGCRVLAECIQRRGSVSGGLACYLGEWNNAYIQRILSLQGQYGIQ